MKLSVRVEGNGFDAIKNITDGFGPAMKKEMTTAVNKTSKFHKNEIARSISKKVAIKQKDVKKVIDVKKATIRPTATVTVNKTTRLSLKYFGARQTKSGVSYRIENGKRRKLRDAFGPSIPRLGNHVYRRAGSARLPLKKKLQGPSPAGVYNKHGLLRVSKEQLEARLDYELNRRVRAVKVRLIRKRGRIKGLSTDQINQQLAAL